MRKKLHASIIKLMSIDINLHQAAVHYNTHMIKSFYFGYGVVQLNKGQENELKRLHEALLLVKLELSKNFPCHVLCSRKSILGVGAIFPSKGITSKAIDAQEEYLQVEVGRHVSIRHDLEDRDWHSAQIDEVNDVPFERNISFH